VAANPHFSQPPLNLPPTALGSPWERWEVVISYHQCRVYSGFAERQHPLGRN
jgi:hypothetical protein